MTSQHLPDYRPDDKAVLEYLRNKTWANRHSDEDCPHNSPSQEPRQTRDLEEIVCDSPPYINIPVSRDPEDSPKASKIARLSPFIGETFGTNTADSTKRSIVFNDTTPQKNSDFAPFTSLQTKAEVDT